MATHTQTPSTMTDSTIAVFESSGDALVALKALRDAGLGEEEVSVIGKGVTHAGENHGWIPRGSTAAGYGGWGELWSELTGWLILGFVWIPGIGWVAAGGWLVTTIAESAFGSGLGALTGIGVPASELPDYEAEVTNDRYLVAVHGPEAAVRRAEGILQGSGSSVVRTYAV